MKTTIELVALTPELREQMRIASETDRGHHAPFATHAFTRAGAVVGAAAIFAPIMTFWAHSTLLSARESFQAIHHAQNLAEAKALPYGVLCSPDSPFFPLMKHCGYERIGNADLFSTV